MRGLKDKSFLIRELYNTAMNELMAFLVVIMNLIYIT